VAGIRVNEIGNQASNGSDRLGAHPVDEDVSIFGIWKDSLCGVIDTEVGNLVDNNTLYMVQTLNLIRFVHPDQDMAEAFEFLFSSGFAHNSC
jgi:hypothetical protein